MEISITKSIAQMVYAGIVCDTGRFLFPNTTFRSLAVCTEMMKYGASPSVIGEKLYCRTNQTTIRSLAVALSTLEFHFDESVACISLSNGTLKEMEDLDTEGFVDYLLAIEGTIVEFFMFEMEPETYRISFRSKNKVDVNRVAKALGGGGHARAAGCILQGDLAHVKRRILNELQHHL
jgi:phosphoesterase RecJ-like protein